MVHETSSQNINGKIVVLVDDVLLPVGHKRPWMLLILVFQIQLAVLVTEYRELIRADYVGKNVPTSDEIIASCLRRTVRSVVMRSPWSV